MSEFLNPFASNGQVSEATEGVQKVVTSIPTADEPLVLKFIYTPQRKSHVPLLSWKFKFGPNESDVAYRPDLMSLGGSASPERDQMNKIRMTMSNLKKEGKRDTEEYDKYITLNRIFSPKEGGYLYFVKPEDSNIYALRVGKSVLNRIFGKEATQYRPAVKSLIEELKKKGLCPYLTGDEKKDAQGWIKVWKTGEGIGTEYHLEMDVYEDTIDVDGEMVTTTKSKKYSVHQKIATGQITLDDYPDALMYEIDRAWTVEESNQFVESNGAYVPERVMEKFNNKKDGGTYQPSESLSSEVQDIDNILPPNLDSIPF